MPAYVRKLLWIDCTAGAVVGVAVLALHGWLSEFFGLPRGVLLFTGAANLAYATYSFSLARRRERPLRLVQILAGANMAWGLVVCLGLAAIFWDTASGFGRAHLLAEAAFVAGLGAVEWRERERLTTA